MRRRDRRTAICLAVAALCTVPLAGCGSSSSSTRGGTGSSAKAQATPAVQSSKSPVVIALITFKIPSLDFIDDYYAGAEGAANEINAMGGVGGRPVKIIQCNSMLEPAVATECAHQTLAQHPVAEFGCETSWSASGLPIYAAAGVPSFNCTNSHVDYTSPWSFGLGPGAPGEASAMAKYICATMPTVKRVAYLTPVNPEEQADIPPTLTPIFRACGKQVSFTFIPQTAVDMSPVIAAVMASKPDFIMTTIGGVQMVEVAKALQQAGWPSDKLSISDNALDKKNVLDPAGPYLNGVYVDAEWTGWGISSDPDVEAYQKAVQGASNPDSGNVVQGYMPVMAIYTAAKHIGFANFNSTTLTQFMRSANGIAIPMSRQILNPGPSVAPSVKQPYIQILRYSSSGMTVQTQGTDNGWVEASFHS